MTRARNIHRFLSLVLFGLVVTMLSGLLPAPVFAATTTSDLQGEAIQISGEISWVAKLIALLSYVVGTAFAVRSLFALKGFIQSPDDVPVNRFIGLASVSALLIMLPYSIHLTQNTLSTAGQTSMVSSATNFNKNNPMETCGTDAKIGNVFCRVATQIRPFASFLGLVAYVIAANLALTGLLNLKSYGDDPSQTPIRSIIMKFVLATMLISLPLSMQIFVSTFTGSKLDDQAVTVSRPHLFTGSLK